MRGVKQGDALSSLPFNAGPFRRWKSRLLFEGWLIDENGYRLTNTRYADDILLYAKSAEELKLMMNMLLEKLPKIGLSANTSKERS